MDGRAIGDAVVGGIIAVAVLAAVVGGALVGVGMWLWQHVGLVWPFYWK